LVLWFFQGSVTDVGAEVLGVFFGKVKEATGLKAEMARRGVGRGGLEAPEAGQLGQGDGPMISEDRYYRMLAVVEAAPEFREADFRVGGDAAENDADASAGKDISGPIDVDVAGGEEAVPAVFVGKIIVTSCGAEVSEFDGRPSQEAFAAEGQVFAKGLAALWYG